MKLPAFVPSPAEIGRETIVLVCGALLAAWIMGQWPAGRAYIRNAWGNPGTP